MLQTQPSTKPANKNLSIAFANDNFCGNFFALFPNCFSSANFKNNSSSLIPNASSLFAKKADRFFLTLRVCGKTSFYLEDDSRTGIWHSQMPVVARNEPLARFFNAPTSRRGLFRFAPKPVFAKFERQENANSIFSENGVRVFLTLKPIAQNTDGSLKTNADGTYQSISGDSIKNINITSAILKSEHWEEHKSSSINPVNIVKAAVKKVAKVANKVVDKAQRITNQIATQASDITGIEAIEDGVAAQNKALDKNQAKATDHILATAYGVDANSDNSKNDAIIRNTESKSASSSTTEASSNINVGGNLMLNSTENTTIKASNLTIKGNALINTGGSLLITSAEETSNSSQKTKDLAIGELTGGFKDHSLQAGVKGSGTENKYQEEDVIQKSSNINIGGSLLTNTAKDTSIVASHVVVGNDATIKTGGDFNLSDAKNTQKTNEENSKLEVEVGVKIGNAYVDTGYAAKALLDAAKALKGANDKLNKMQNLKSQGRASQKAVDLAYTQVALATAGVATATVNLNLSAQNSAAASTSLGMYGAAYVNTTYHTDFTKTNLSQSVGSTLTVGYATPSFPDGNSFPLNKGNIAIDAAKNFNQTGSALTSNNGNIAISATTANIKAGENTFESTFGSKTVTASASIGNNGLGLAAGYNQSDNYTLSNTFTNSQINATKGTFKLTTTGDTNLIGGNIIANKVNLNIGGNLNLETLQDTYESNGSSFGINISGGIRGAEGSAIGSARNSIGNFEQGTLGGGVNNPNNGQGTRLGQQNATPNFGVSVGMNETFIKKTTKATGIIELSTNDAAKTEAENLTNLLGTNSGLSTGSGSNPSSINVAGTITNNTQKEDINFTNADFNGYLDTNTISNTINSAVWLGNLTNAEGRDQAGRDVKELAGNLKITVNQSAKVIDMPLVAAATSDVPILKDIANKIAGNGGSVATLATQLFGLSYLLDSGNGQYNTNTIQGLNNNELKTAIQNQDKFEVKKDQNGNEMIVITDKQGNAKSYDYEISKKLLSDVNLSDLTTNKDYGFHGVYNNADEAFRNQLMQLGTLQNYDSKTDQSSFVSVSAPTKGLITDGIENFYNSIFGKTPLASANMQEMKDFGQTLGAVGKYQNVTTQTSNGGFNTIQNPMTDIRMAAHSNGGDRLYLGVLGGASGGQLSSLTNLQVQLYGTPSKTSNIRTTAENSGLTNFNQIQNIINPGDFVGKILGRNATDSLDAGKAIIMAPLLFITPLSPHSNYYCQGSFCQFDKYK